MPPYGDNFGHVLVQVFAAGTGQEVLDQEGRALEALRSVSVGAPSDRPLPPPDSGLRPLDRPGPWRRTRRVGTAGLKLASHVDQD